MEAKQISKPPVLVVNRSLRRTMWAGAAIIAVFFVGLGTWAAHAPLAGAALAPAVTSPDGNRREVQHLEGGIVKQLLVREGTEVDKGEILLTLDSSQARADRDVLREELRSLLARRARLIAERDDDAEISFPDELLSDPTAEIQRMLETQRNLFDKRRIARAQRTEILSQQLSQHQQAILGAESQIASQNQQLDLIRDELAGVDDLVRRGYERRPRLLALKRKASEVEGAKAAAQSTAAQTRKAMSETLARITEVETGHLEEVSKELAEIEATLPTVREKLRAAVEIVKRTIIKAPVTGTVVELKANTIGGVISPGQTILEIVPRNEEILFDAKVSPNDIDDVRAGLEARIVLTGYSQRNMPALFGSVRQVSADRITDPETNQAYYLARIELPAEQLQKIRPQVILQSGMPAEIMVMTKERTALDYFFEPLLASFRKSFRES